MKSNPVCWFEIYVKDMDRAKVFYEGVFETKLDELPAPPAPEGQEDCGGNMKMFTFPMSEDDYGAAGALIEMEDVPSGPGGSLVYFACDDCAVEAARVSKLGGSVFREKMPIGEHGFIAIFNDTEGNMVGLHSMK